MRRPRSLIASTLAVIALIALVLAACSSSQPGVAGNGVNQPPGGGPGGCTAGDTTSCNLNEGTVNGIVTCVAGTKTCKGDGSWGPCIPPSSNARMFHRAAREPLRLNKGLNVFTVSTTPSSCSEAGIPVTTDAAAGDGGGDAGGVNTGTWNDPCDPGCQAYYDIPDAGITQDAAVVLLTSSALQCSNIPQGFINKGTLNGQCAPAAAACPDPDPTNTETTQSCAACQFDTHCDYNGSTGVACVNASAICTTNADCATACGGNPGTCTSLPGSGSASCPTQSVCSCYPCCVPYEVGQYDTAGVFGTDTSGDTVWACNNLPDVTAPSVCTPQIPPGTATCPAGGNPCPDTAHRNLTICNRGTASLTQDIQCFDYPGNKPQFPNDNPGGGSLVLDTATTGATTCNGNPDPSGWWGNDVGCPPFEKGPASFATSPLPAGQCRIFTLERSDFPSQGTSSVICNPPLGGGSGSGDAGTDGGGDAGTGITATIKSLPRTVSGDSSWSNLCNILSDTDNQASAQATYVSGAAQTAPQSATAVGTPVVAWSNPAYAENHTAPGASIVVVPSALGASTNSGNTTSCTTSGAQSICEAGIAPCTCGTAPTCTASTCSATCTTNSSGKCVSWAPYSATATDTVAGVLSAAEGPPNNGPTNGSRTMRAYIGQGDAAAVTLTGFTPSTGAPAGVTIQSVAANLDWCASRDQLHVQLYKSDGVTLLADSQTTTTAAFTQPSNTSTAVTLSVGSTAEMVSGANIYVTGCDSTGTTCDTACAYNVQAVNTATSVTVLLSSGNAGGACAGSGISLVSGAIVSTIGQPTASTFCAAMTPVALSVPASTVASLSATDVNNGFVMVVTGNRPIAAGSAEYMYVDSAAVDVVYAAPAAPIGQFTLDGFSALPSAIPAGATVSGIQVVAQWSLSAADANVELGIQPISAGGNYPAGANIGSEQDFGITSSYAANSLVTSTATYLNSQLSTAILAADLASPGFGIKVFARQPSLSDNSDPTLYVNQITVIVYYSTTTPTTPTLTVGDFGFVLPAGGTLQSLTVSTNVEINTENPSSIINLIPETAYGGAAITATPPAAGAPQYGQAMSTSFCKKTWTASTSGLSSATFNDTQAATQTQPVCTQPNDTTQCTSCTTNDWWNIAQSGFAVTATLGDGTSPYENPSYTASIDYVSATMTYTGGAVATEHAAECDPANNWTVSKENPQVACSSGAAIPPWYYSIMFNASCASGSAPQWQLFGWDSATPNNTSIQVAFHTYQYDSSGACPATTANYSTSLGALIPTDNPQVCNVTQPLDDAAPNLCPVNMQTVLGGLPTGDYPCLEMDVTGTPDNNAGSSPTLYSWQVTYDCVNTE